MHSTVGQSTMASNSSIAKAFYKGKTPKTDIPYKEAVSKGGRLKRHRKTPKNPKKQPHTPVTGQNSVS